MVDTPAVDGRNESNNLRTTTGQNHQNTAVVLDFHKENKTRTLCDCDDRRQWRGKPIADALGIRRTWRQVVDFGDPKSSGIGDSWGYKTVSVAWVSLLNTPVVDDEPIAP